MHGLRLLQHARPATSNRAATGKIAIWLLDTDYDGRSLFPRQVFFPMAGEKEGWARLAKNLKAEIDEELIEAYRGTVSLPFEAGRAQAHRGQDRGRPGHREPESAGAGLMAQDDH